MGGSLSPELRAILVMEATGWTHDQYLDQPEWVVETLLGKWSADAERANREKKRR